jgi:predicted metal-dependent phosphotriesterase family hydrolase
MKSLKQKQRLMIILNDQSQEKTSIKQSNITTKTSTNIGTNKQNLEELKKQTLLNILSAKGVIYTYYKNNQLMRKQ